MKISYDEKEDILFIRFSDKPVVKDISYGWNVTAGVTEDGLGQITVLDARHDGLLPLEAPKNLLKA
ncbi:MAG: DUF2283 domain-containing protein [Mariprofundaceae bacterium]|nr:DUF2283 domain-containing protein [Mariprofundaceae bacterium]